MKNAASNVAIVGVTKRATLRNILNANWGITYTASSLLAVAKVLDPTIAAANVTNYLAELQTAGLVRWTTIDNPKADGRLKVKSYRLVRKIPEPTAQPTPKKAKAVEKTAQVNIQVTSFENYKVFNNLKLDNIGVHQDTKVNSYTKKINLTNMVVGSSVFVPLSETEIARAAVYAFAKANSGRKFITRKVDNQLLIHRVV